VEDGLCSAQYLVFKTQLPQQLRTGIRKYTLADLSFHFFTLERDDVLAGEEVCDVSCENI
jgi:hypothetical protein